MEEQKFTLCRCRKGGSCPQVFITEDEVKIKDDYGNTVKMTKDQFLIIEDVLKDIKQ